MKAITIHQPWATLAAIGEKDNETRGWATKYRGPLAIHAGKHVDREACEREPIKSTLAEHGYTADNLPTGAIVGYCNLSECYGIHIDHTGDAVLTKDDSPAWWIGSGTNEFHFGWYSDGRFAWHMEDRKFLEEPIPAKGQQGIWNWNHPGE